MGRCKFVTPDVTRIQLADGNWIEVKNMLSIGDVRHLARLVGGEGAGGDKRARLPIGYAQTLVCLVDWSLRDANDKSVAIENDDDRMAALDALQQDDYQEIETAIDVHMKGVLAAAAKKKPTPHGSSKRNSTSASAAS